MIRIAASGDLHVGVEDAGTVAPRFAGVGERCDALLLAGDLSRRGLPEEARVLAEGLGDIHVPVVAVLGNHDLESDQQAAFREILASAGITVLEGESTVVDAPDGRVGIAATVGFGGGFQSATCADFGEPEMKAFAARSRRLAASLARALDEVADADRVVALTHYAPVRDTVVGESPELYPFLGSHGLAQAIDAGRADVALHGHAHHGSPRGRTPSGVPVRNVAQPVIRAPYRIFELEAPDPRSETSR